MKCTACGLPLSPARANASCPRCGTPAGGGSKSTGDAVGFEPAAWNGNMSAPVSVGAPPQGRMWEQARSSAFQPPLAPAPQPGQMWDARSNGMQGPGSFSPMPPAPRRPARNSRVGFLVAGICVCAGGLLLVLVYFLAMGQSGNTSTTSSTSTRTAATSTAAVTPSPAGSPSPTATYPGQQYISNAQLSSVQPSASQTAAPATTFKVHTTFYVGFNINSGGQAGAICLKWYLNGQFAFKYSFAVGAHTTASYGQATLDLPGSGYVELYWASSKDCTNEALAQHVNFTITT